MVTVKDIPRTVAELVDVCETIELRLFGVALDSLDIGGEIRWLKESYVNRDAFQVVMKQWFIRSTRDDVVGRGQYPWTFCHFDIDMGAGRIEIDTVGPNIMSIYLAVHRHPEVEYHGSIDEEDWSYRGTLSRFRDAIESYEDWLDLMDNRYQVGLTR